MRSEREIREKIESLDGQKFGNPKLDEDYCLQIDMLLWVLEDESGLPPLDEREKAVAKHAQTMASVISAVTATKDLNIKRRRGYDT